MSNITVGADPEVFFLKNGAPFPAVGLVGGTKEKPLKCGIGHVQEDNVMAEFNPPPASTPQEFEKNVSTMLKEVEKLAEKHGCTVSKDSVVYFNPDILYKLEQAYMMGCEPDFNAWTGEYNPPVDSHRLKELRCAAGHVHIGFPGANEHPHSRVMLTQLLDIFLGIPLVYMYGKSKRRDYYGMAGAFRPTPYGVEYRVPDNSWIFKPGMARWIFNQSISAFRSLRSIGMGNHQPMRSLDRGGNGVALAINSGDKSACRAYMRLWKIKTP